MVDQNTIEGRGGASMAYIGKQGLDHEFVLIGGASRDQQFEDIWKISVGLGPQGRTYKYTKMDVKERDGFSARNAGSAIAFGGKKVLIFGG